MLLTLNSISGKYQGRAPLHLSSSGNRESFISRSCDVLDTPIEKKPGNPQLRSGIRSRRMSCSIYHSARVGLPKIARGMLQCYAETPLQPASLELLLDTCDRRVRAKHSTRSSIPAIYEWYQQDGIARVGHFICRTSNPGACNLALSRL